MLTLRTQLQYIRLRFLTLHIVEALLGDDHAQLSHTTMGKESDAIVNAPRNNFFFQLLSRREKAAVFFQR